MCRFDGSSRKPARNFRLFARYCGRGSCSKSFAPCASPDQRHHIKRTPIFSGCSFLCVVSTDRAVSPQEIFAFLHITAGGVRARRALHHAQAPTSGTTKKNTPLMGVLFLCIVSTDRAVSPQRNFRLFARYCGRGSCSESFAPRASPDQRHHRKDTTFWCVPKERKPNRYSASALFTLHFA